MGLLNTHLGVILGLGAGGQLASTLLYAGYFRGLPQELEECARLDGGGRLRVFFKLMPPLAWASTATVGILTFLLPGNNYRLPLVFTREEQGVRTVAAGNTAG